MCVLHIGRCLHRPGCRLCNRPSVCVDARKLCLLSTFLLNLDLWLAAHHSGSSICTLLYLYHEIYTYIIYDPTALVPGFDLRRREWVVSPRPFPLWHWAMCSQSPPVGLLWQPTVHLWTDTQSMSRHKRLSSQQVWRWSRNYLHYTPLPILRVVPPSSHAYTLKKHCRGHGVSIPNNHASIRPFSHSSLLSFLPLPLFYHPLFSESPL